MQDRFQRRLEYLRLSVTDFCNLRCRYCMPETGVKALRHADILTYEEMLRVVRVLAKLGVRKVRLTGGEPLVRRGLLSLVKRLKETPGIETVALTTNGVMLSDVLDDLVAAGLDAVNLSLDTLHAKRFARLTRRPMLPQVLTALHLLLAKRHLTVKVNCVPLRGVNEDELTGLAALARTQPISVRFIELMPIGCARTAGLSGLPMAEVRAVFQAAFGALYPVLPERNAPAGPAALFRPAGFSGTIGLIDAIDHKFCARCNRLRLTADGFLKLCLYSAEGVDLRALLRGGASDEALREAILSAVWIKPAEHHFQKEDDEQRDERAMYQVGG